MGRKNRRKVEYRRRLPTVKQLYARGNPRPLAHPYIHHDDTEDYPRRMEFWFAHIPMYASTSIEGGDRPVLIVSNDKANQHSRTVTVIPLTSKIKRMDIPTHVLVKRTEELTRDSVVLAEQITTLSRDVLTRKLGDCKSPDLIAAVERAMKIQLGLGKEGLAMNYPMGRSMDTCRMMQDYLDFLPDWDGVPRLGGMLTDYLGADDNEFVQAVSRKMLVAAVARTYNPGTPFDHIIFLFGPSGIGKSMLLLKLAGQFCEEGLWSEVTGETLSGLHTEGVAILEVTDIPEALLKDTDRVEHNECVHEAIHFVDKTEDMVENEQGELVHMNRSFIPVMTNNLGCSFLDSYRYCWPVRVGFHKPTQSVMELGSAVIEQLWAEAKMLYTTGESLELSPSEFSVGTR